MGDVYVGALMLADGKGAVYVGAVALGGGKLLEKELEGNPTLGKVLGYALEYPLLGNPALGKLLGMLDAG